MSLTRRALLAASAMLLVPSGGRADSVTDAAGRAIQIPETVKRVFPAGPPAAIMLYTLASDLLLGWPRANRAEECAFMLPDVCARPEVGRLTGRGNTANLESVLALKPDLILDAGSTAPTFVSLATRVQEQTGIPYALLDGRFEATASTYRLLGALTHRDAESLAAYTENTLASIQARVNRIPEDERPASIMRAGLVDWRLDLAGRLTWRPSSFWARATLQPSAGAGWPQSPWNRCSSGIRK
jgi:iron complex transport system substrate-binding protein